MPLESAESLPQRTINQESLGSLINRPRQTGSQQYDFLLNFGIELEVILVYDPSSFRRNALMNKSKNSRYAEIKRVREHFNREKHPGSIPKPALWLARDILQREGLAVASIGHAPDDQDLPYSGWGLVEDSTIKCDCLHAEALKRIPDRFDDHVPVTITGGGVELVSRKFPAPDLDTDDFSCPSLEEISNYINALTGKSTDPFGCITNDSCGLHVHIGVAALKSPDKPRKFPLAILQHLCHILAQYETVISSLFPLSRRATNPNRPPWLGSNMMGLRRTRHVRERHADPSPEDHLSHLTARIFAPDMTANRLIDHMSETPSNPSKPGGTSIGTRHKFISFENLSSLRAHQHAPPTLEFHQHESTLDTSAIHHWIRFVSSLVRAAERAANNAAAAQPPPIPPPAFRYECTHTTAAGEQAVQRENEAGRRILEGTLADLFELLALGGRQREYWRGRVRAFNNDREEVPESGEARS